MKKRPIDILSRKVESAADVLSETPISRVPGVKSAYSKISKKMSDRRYQNVDVPEKLSYRGKTLYVFPESRWAKRIYLDDEYSGSDEHEWSIFKENVSEGDVVFDIGAFVGTHTLMMRELVGESGQIYSLEPQPDCANLIKKTASANSFANCRVINKAAGDENGVQELETSKTPDATSNVIGSDPWERHDTLVEVDMIRLDDFLDENRIDHVDFMKIDVQGSGLEVIRGLDGRISDVSKIYMEVHSKYIRNTSEVVEELFDILHTNGEIIRTDAGEGVPITDAEELIFEEEHPSIIWVST